MPGLLEKNQIGKREDLADFVSIADEKEKPLLAMIPKGKKLTNTLMQWTADKYDDPDTAGVVDGADVTDYENASENKGLLKAYVQKFRRTAKVSEMAQDVSVVAGEPDTMAEAVEKKLEELGRDIEAALCADNDTQADDGTVPYKLRGLGEWIKATAQATLPVPTAFLTPTASIDGTTLATFNEESNFKPVLKSVFEQRGKNQHLTLICGTAFKQKITGFTQFQGASANTYGTIRAYNADLNERKITSNVTVYEGDFNTVVLHPSLLLANGTANAPTRRGYVMDLEMLELRWNKMPAVKKLPDLDGGPRAAVTAICGLVCKNPLAFGKFNATAG